MISAKIRDPESKNEFMEFVHGTTCIVAIPHGAASELWITSDHPCTLVIEAAGQELEILPVTPPGGSVKISDLRQPLQRQGVALGEIFKFGPFRRRPLLSQPCQRLYNFRAVIEDGSPENRGELLATFDFHLLCEVDFHWARAYHLELDRANAAGHTVTQRAEGTCLFCQEARTRLQKTWRFED